MSFSRDIFVAVRRTSTSNRVALAISVLRAIRRPCFFFFNFLQAEVTTWQSRNLL